MAHRADIVDALKLVHADASDGCADVVFLSVAPGAASAAAEAVVHICKSARDGCEIVLYGDMSELARVHATVPRELIYHICIAVRATPAARAGSILPRAHRALLFYGKRRRDLVHARVRIGYDYCPACGKTTKDYGGRKHLYHEYGTLMSDVWKDIEVDPEDPYPANVVGRVRDMMSAGGRSNMSLSLVSQPGPGTCAAADVRPIPASLVPPDERFEAEHLQNGTLFRGDALGVMGTLANESIDLAFADPPYNLAKKYTDYRDRLDVSGYFSWCDRWLGEYLRLLRPGGFLAVLNIPLWAMRHAAFLEGRATVSNWVVWEAMSMPVRLIMPSNYSLLLYQKEPVREHIPTSTRDYQDDLTPMPIGFCRRASCVSRRGRADSPGPLGDLWTDIDRLKHNSVRWDHPCQLPPKLMRRVIACTTRPGDVVLDAFNGIGTTTLAAQQISRRYIGVELSPDYHSAAVCRHRMLEKGEDPFAKRPGTPTVKNNNVRRQGEGDYRVPKKDLQLAVKRLAQRLGRIPTREEVERHLPFPIAYFDNYFKSWSEVVAAARTTGMTERPKTATPQGKVDDHRLAM